MNTDKMNKIADSMTPDQEEAAKLRIEARKANNSDLEKNKIILKKKLIKNMLTLSLFGERIEKLQTLSSYNIPNNGHGQQYNDIYEFAVQFVDDLVSGKNYNIVFIGTPGTGKTFLSKSIMADLITKTNTVIFINTTSLKSLAFSSWGDKKKAHKLEKIKNYAMTADLLILDDLGTETSNAARNTKEASETVQQLLYEIMNSRQNKATLITSNNGLEEFKAMYSPKLISRLLPKNAENVLNFTGLDDLRNE